MSSATVPAFWLTTPLQYLPFRLTAFTTAAAGSVGGEICIWKADGDWELVKTMKGHKAAVNCLAAHPSGSLALSVSRDKQMRLWDLTKGSCAYQAPLGSEGDVVGFFPSGDTYFIASSDPATPKGSTISIHNTQVRHHLDTQHLLSTTNWYSMLAHRNLTRRASPLHGNTKQPPLRTYDLGATP